uniref:Cytochrome P450 n=1 Tax=Manihot esculenta TaxID=3983 RepID=A0A2C9UN54_MANES
MILYTLCSWMPVFLLPFLLLIKRNMKVECENKQLPPSPHKCKEHRRRNNPILGNLHQLGELPHQAYWQLSKKYGSVMLVKLGRISNVIVSSAEAAKQVLKDHDLARCSRPQLAGATRLSYNYSDVAFTPYGDYWRNMKKLIILELYSLKRVKSFQALREREIELFINSISESAASATPVNLTEKLLSLTANITFKMSFGFDYHGTDFDRKRFPEVVHDSEAVVAAFSIGELIPYVGWILDTFFQYVINDHLKPERKKEQDDVIDVLIRTKKEQADLGNSKFTNNTIKGVLLNLFAAGVDTSAIIVNWAMAELAKNPRVMKKVQNEIRNCYRL